MTGWARRRQPRLATVAPIVVVVLALASGIVPAADGVASALPMMVSRVVLDPNETGIECNLTFTARTACVEEGRQTLRQGVRPMLDSTRFAQFGRWRGTVRYNGKTVAVDETRVFGTKDRSWGLRPVGEPETGGAPARRMPQVFFLWAPVHWEDHCTHFGVFEDETGHRLHSDGAIVPAHRSPDEIPGVMDPDIRTMASVEHEIRYVPGTRRAQSARISLIERSGERHDVELEPLICFRMKGIGYMHPEWGHGRWKGEMAIGGESWRTADLNELALENIHIQQVMRARSEGRQGLGVLEQICLGPHAPSRFQEFLDGAPPS